MQIRNQYDLIREHERLNPDSVMFSKETLKFWSETKRRMRLTGKVSIRDFRGTEHECYRLEVFRTPDEETGRPEQGEYYFDTTTLERILPRD